MVEARRGRQSAQHQRLDARYNSHTPAWKALAQIKARLDIGQDLNGRQEWFLKKNPGLLEEFISAQEHQMRLNGQKVNSKTRRKPSTNVHFQ